MSSAVVSLRDWEEREKMLDILVRLLCNKP